MLIICYMNVDSRIYMRKKGVVCLGFAVKTICMYVGLVTDFMCLLLLKK